MLESGIRSMRTIRKSILACGILLLLQGLLFASEIYANSQYPCPQNMLIDEDGALVRVLGDARKQDIVIPEGVTAIHGDAFPIYEEYLNISDPIMLAEELKEAETRVWLPGSVTKVDEGTFVDRPYISFVVISKDATGITPEAFAPTQSVIFEDKIPEEFIKKHDKVVRLNDRNRKAYMPRAYMQMDHRIEVDGLLYGVEERGWATVLGRANQEEYAPKIEIPKIIFVNGDAYRVVRIGPRAFRNEVLTSLSMGNTVTSVCKEAFGGCYFIGEEGIKLSANLHYVGDHAFACSTRHVAMHARKQRKDGAILKNGVLYSADGTELITVFGDFQDIKPSDSVVHIRADAFCDKKDREGVREQIQRIWIPEKVEGISKNTFRFLPDLKSVIFMGTPQRIEDYAWGDGKVHDYVWESELKNLIFRNPDPPTYIGRQHSVQCVYVPKGSAEAYRKALDGKIEYDKMIER